MYKLFPWIQLFSLNALFLPSYPAVAEVFPSPSPSPSPSSRNSEGASIELISPEICGILPHLCEFAGQILLANNKAHFVIAGALPEPSGEGFEPLVSAIFVRNGQNWQRQAEGLALDILLGTVANKRLLTPVSWGSGTIDGEAMLDLSFQAVANPNLTSLVRLVLGPDESTLRVFFKDFLTAAPRLALGRWQLRARLEEHETAALVEGPSSDIGALRTLVVAGSNSGGVAVMPIGSGHFSSPQRGEYRLEPSSGLSAGQPGFMLLAGNEGLGSMAHQAWAVKRCLTTGKLKANRKPSLEAFQRSLRQCESGLDHAEIVLNLKPSEVGNKKSERQWAELRNEQSQVLGLFPFGPESQALLKVMPETGSEIRWRGQLAPPLKIAAISSLARHQIDFMRPPSFSITVNQSGASAPAWASLNNEKYWQQQALITWPLNASLAPGTYNWRIIQPGFGQACSLQFTLSSSGEIPRQSCALKPIQAASNYMRVDLSAPPAGFDTATWQGLAALNVSARAALAKPSATEVSYIATQDPAHWETLRLYPVTSDIFRQWQDLSASPESALIKIQGLQDRSASATTLELSCPPAWVSPAEYRRAILRLHVQAAQVHGCGDQARDTALWQALEQANRPQTPLVQSLSASSSRQRRSGQQPVLIMATGSQIVQMPELLRQGHFSMSEGAVLQWQESSEKINRRQQIRGTLQVQAEAGVSLRKLRVLSSNGLLREIPLSPGTIPLSFNLPPGSFWYRLEALGTINGLALTTVATTGLIPLVTFGNSAIGL